jgi:translocation protein SEC66
LVQPYFPTHPERDAYVTLLQRTDPPAPDALLKSALVRRAMGDVHRALRIREDKPALQNLLQKGSIGDDLWNSLLSAEKELEAEIVEVVNEANAYVEGWGSVIFQTANEMIANEKMRATFERMQEAKELLAAKYDLKAKVNSPSTPAQSPAPKTPARPPSTLSGLLNGTDAKPPNGLPHTPTTPATASASDGEAQSGPTTPRTPKSPGKKGKKRK